MTICEKPKKKYFSDHPSNTPIVESSDHEEHDPSELSTLSSKERLRRQISKDVKRWLDRGNIIQPAELAKDCKASRRASVSDDSYYA
jgi:hypothetical protein